MFLIGLMLFCMEAINTAHDFAKGAKRGRRAICARLLPA